MGKQSRRKPKRDVDADTKAWIAEEFERRLDLDAAGKAIHPLAARDRACGLSPLEVSTKRVKARRPSCDVCGAEDARYKCVRCNAETYCGRDCQTHAWKVGDHKQRCATLRDRSEAEAAAIVARRPRGRPRGGSRRRRGRAAESRGLAGATQRREPPPLGSNQRPRAPRQRSRPRFGDHVRTARRVPRRLGGAGRRRRTDGPLRVGYLLRVRAIRCVRSLSGPAAVDQRGGRIVV